MKKEESKTPFLGFIRGQQAVPFPKKVVSDRRIIMAFLNHFPHITWEVVAKSFYVVSSFLDTEFYPDEFSLIWEYFLYTFTSLGSKVQGEIWQS